MSFYPSFSPFFFCLKDITQQKVLSTKETLTRPFLFCKVLRGRVWGVLPNYQKSINKSSKKVGEKKKKGKDNNRATVKVSSRKNIQK